MENLVAITQHDELPLVLTPMGIARIFLASRWANRTASDESAFSSGWIK